MSARRARGLFMGCVLAAALLGLAQPRAAKACGCLSPPVPGPADADFGVNQQSEVIIFEVDQGDIATGVFPSVTAHVLIRYAGDPEQFAWIVPVPSVPEIELSYTGAFGWLDTQTAPQPLVGEAANRCPQQEYACNQHPRAFCPSPPPPPPPCSTGTSGGGSSFGNTSPTSGTNFSGALPTSGDSGDFAGDPMQAPGAEPPPVQVFARAQIGAYDTVTFGAGDAQAAVDWLQNEGFIVNDTMTPYMQPYLDANMLFVASKLVPGADADEIRPLRMRYLGTTPMIPLQLTAVAAEPHLTVTAMIFANMPFRPLDHPLVSVPPSSIARGLGGRVNYPMALARAIDEAGGDGFIQEWSGGPPTYAVNDPGGCCGGDFDTCGIAFNGQCECPMSPVDVDDCSADEELLGTLTLLQDLTSRFTYLTRLTTRLSPEEMTFDPAFTPVGAPSMVPAPMGSAIRPRGLHVNLEGCEPDVIDQDTLADVRAIEACASVYCGDGTCAAAGGTVGCVCNSGTVARVFNDLDGRPSITCVPEVPPVDLEAGGLVIPDVCAGSALEEGECVALGGFRATRCGAGMAAIMEGAATACAPVELDAGDPGARDYQAPLAELEICAPAPPDCSPEGWLTRSEVQIQGEVCDANVPHDSWLDVPAQPTCATRMAVETLDASERQPRTTLEPRPDLLAGLQAEIEAFQIQVDEIEAAIAEAEANPPACIPVDEDGRTSGLSRSPRASGGSGGDASSGDGGSLCSASTAGGGRAAPALLCLLVPLLMRRRRRRA